MTKLPEYVGPQKRRERKARERVSAALGLNTRVTLRADTRQELQDLQRALDAIGNPQRVSLGFSSVVDH